MSAVGRSCANTIKRSRQNVAIATQVLSPSAIGGSLRGQRRLKHFGPPDDDEEEFITYRRRAAWRKLGYYGLAIIVTILILMATILAVGYLQTQNKSNSMVVSRSIKLIQEGQPSSYIYTSKTTPSPPSAEPTDSQEFAPTSHSSFLRSYTKEDSLERVIGNHNEESEESGSTVGEDDYLVTFNLERDKNEANSDNLKDNVDKDPNQPLHVQSYTFHIDHDDDDPDNHDHHHETNHSGLSGSDNKGDKDESVEGSTSDDKLENDLDTATNEKESVHNDVSNNNSDWKSNSIVDTDTETQDSTKEVNEDELPTKEKLLPPKDSVFSLEIPIYANNKTSVEFATFVEKADPTEHLVTIDVDIKSENDTKDATQEENSEKVITDTNERIGNIKINSNRRTSNLLDNEPFHQGSLLHTALFHLDEDNREVKSKPGATAIIIEDQDYEDSTPFSDSHYADQSFTNRPRNHKVKILKNDQVMNMKATYTPERMQASRIRNHLREPEKKNDAPGANAAQKQKSRAKSGGSNVPGTKNKTSSEWKLRLKVNKEEKSKDYLENVTEASLDRINVFTHPDSSSLNEQKNIAALKKNYAETKEIKPTSEEKPRLLSASSFLPNFESFMKAILSNIQHTNAKSSDGPHHQGTSEFGTSYANNLDHFLPASTLPSPTVELDPSNFRKRTYISDHDIFDIPSPIQAASQLQPENYFDRLLGQIPTVGSIGSPTATGASFLNNYQTPIFPTTPTITHSTTSPFEISHSSSSSDNPHLAPGVIPLDLASSFIQVGNGLPKSEHNGHQNQPSSYGGNFYGNYGAGISTYPLSNTFPKAGNNGGLDGIGTVTTTSGQAPTYNTITQGMHLLNLISGTIPSTYYHDQVYNPSQTTSATFPQNNLLSSFQYPSPTISSNFATSSNILNPYEFNSNNNIPSINSFGASAPPPPPPPPPPSFQLNSFDYQPQESDNRHSGSSNSQGQFSLNTNLIGRALALKSDREAVEKFLEEEDEDDERDQLPSASSFSQSILTTFKKPKDRKKSPIQERTTTAGSIISVMTKPRTRTTTMFKAKPPKKPHSNPKSFSFEILPQRNRSAHNYLSPTANTVMFDDNNVLNLSNEDMYPPFDDSATSRSKKKSGANLNKPRKTLSNRNNSTETHDENTIRSKKTSLSSLNSKNLYDKKIRKEANVAGLKSGFFTHE